MPLYKMEDGTVDWKDSNKSDLLDWQVPRKVYIPMVRQGSGYDLICKFVQNIQYSYAKIIFQLAQILP